MGRPQLIFLLALLLATLSAGLALRSASALREGSAQGQDWAMLVLAGALLYLSLVVLLRLILASASRKADVGRGNK